MSCSQTNLLKLQCSCLKILETPHTYTDTLACRKTATYLNDPSLVCTFDCLQRNRNKKQVLTFFLVGGWSCLGDGARHLCGYGAVVVGHRLGTLFLPCLSSLCHWFERHAVVGSHGVNFEALRFWKQKRRGHDHAQHISAAVSKWRGHCKYF